MGSGASNPATDQAKEMAMYALDCKLRAMFRRFRW